MAGLNSEKLENLFIAINGNLNRGLSVADTDYLKWCNVLQSSTLTEEYPIMLLSGSMREWIGERVVHEISGEKLSVTNRDYELAYCPERCCNAIAMEDRITLLNMELSRRADGKKISNFYFAPYR